MQIRVRIPHLSAGISGNVDVACDVSGADVDSLVARVAGIVDVDVAADKIIITALRANVQDGVRVDVTCGRVDTLPDQESRLVGSVSDARIVVARAYRPRHVFEKRAADTVRYAVDWRQWLLSDRISASDWIVYSKRFAYSRAGRRRARDAHSDRWRDPGYCVSSYK